jgi:hypothetical protein
MASERQQLQVFEDEAAAAAVGIRLCCSCCQEGSRASFGRKLKYLLFFRHGKNESEFRWHLFRQLFLLFAAAAG